jgi:hypothetical protein
MEINKRMKIVPDPESTTTLEPDSWKVMFEHFYSDMTVLLAKESRLIRAEISEKFSEARTALVSMVLGSLFLLVGLFSVVATSIIVLNLFLPLWASAAIVSTIFLIVGGIMVSGAKQKLEADKLKLTGSMETLGEISTTFKERINEFKQHQH